MAPPPTSKQLQEDQEQLVRRDGPDSQVVVAVLRVVEVEAAEAADHGQPAHDLLDVGVGQMVTEVDQTPALLASALRQQQ